MADTLDVITLAEAKAALNLTVSTQDTELASYITAVSRALDDMCRPIVIRTVTAEAHDGGAYQVDLRRAPESPTSATTITTVTEYAGTTATVLAADSNVTQASNGYLFDIGAGRIYRRSSGNDACFATGRRNVVVTYQAGRYADTASVAAHFKQAAAIAVSHMFRNEQGFSAIEDATGGFGRSFSLPNRAMELIAMERRLPAIGG